MPFQGDGNGGGGPTSRISVSPSPINFGNVPASTPTNIAVTVRCRATQGDTAIVSQVNFSGAGYSISGVPALPKVLSDGQSFTFTVTLNSAVLGAKPGDIDVVWTGDPTGSTTSIPLSGTIVGTNITVVPPALDFGDVVIGVTSTGGAAHVNVINNTGGLIHLTGGTFSNPDFDWSGGIVPAFPLALANGASVNLFFQVTPSVAGYDTAICTITTDIAGPYTFPISLVAIGIYFVEAHPLTNATRAFLIGADVLYQTDPTNFNSELIQNLIFNGTLWDRPGQEKTLRRLEILYENIGQCTINVKVSTKRVDLNNLFYDDSDNSDVPLGTAIQDGLEQSAFADINMSGERLMLTITRLANVGPCSLIGFIPHFEDKGEKVESV